MTLKWNKQYTDAVLVALLVILPIVLAGEPFGDDYYRLRDGETFEYYKGIVGSLRYCGRYFALWILQLLAGDKFTFNLFPLPQILGIVIYALSLSWIIQKFGIKDRLVSILVILSALTVPFMYQNYMYQYDALSMCIGISMLSIVPLILIPENKVQWIKFTIIKILLIISALLFYQTAIPSYFIFSVFLYLYSQQNNKFKILCWNNLMLIVAYLIMYIILLFTVDNISYLQHNSKISWEYLPYKILNKPLDIIELMLAEYYAVSFNWLAPSILLLLAFIIMYRKVKIDERLQRISKLEKYISILSVPLIAYITVIFISLPDVTIFKHRMLFSLSSTYFCILFIIFYFCINKAEFLRKIVITLVVVMLLPSITSLSIAMKAYSMQQDYERMLITSVYKGLGHIGLSKDDGRTIILVCDKKWYAPYTKKLLEQKPYMKDWVYAASNHSPAHFGNYMNFYGINALTSSSLSDSEETLILENKAEKLYSHYLYDIYRGVHKGEEKILLCVK